jgi:membrane protease YdiL (CAAX protease family)
MTGIEPGRRPLRGATLWLLLVLPYLAQLVIVVFAAQILATVGERPPRTQAFYYLPNAAIYLLGFLALGGVTVLVARQIGPLREVLALRRTPLLPAIGWSVAALLAALIFARLLEPVFGGSASQDLRQDPFPGGLSATVAIVLIGLAFVVGAPVTEELYFRALLLDPMAAALGRSAAVIGTSVLFGLVHLQPRALPVIIAIGAILAILRFATRSIWPPMAVHGANNALAFTAALVGPLAGPS